MVAAQSLVARISLISLITLIGRITRRGQGSRCRARGPILIGRARRRVLTISWPCRPKPLIGRLYLRIAEGLTDHSPEHDTHASAPPAQVHRRRTGCSL